MSAPTILDVCSNAGTGADGYASRGIMPHGRDLFPQPLYPYPFRTGDVLQILAGIEPQGHDAIHVSAPCQSHTDARHLRKAQGGESRFDDLLTPSLELLRSRWSGKPWIAENVDDRTGHVRAIMAPRAGESLIVLCGSMFGLQVQRHRLFLANFPLTPFPSLGAGKYRGQGCRHETFPLDPVSGRPRPWGVYHVKGDSVPAGGRTARDERHAAEVMGCRRVLPWDNLKEGFPPAYTAHVADDLLRHLAMRAQVAA